MVFMYKTQQVNNYLQFDLMRKYTIEVDTTQPVHYNYKVLQNPIYLKYEMCSIADGTTITGYHSPFNVYPNATSKTQTYSYAYNKTNTIFYRLPADTNSDDYYENLNFFVSLLSTGNVTLQASLLIGSTAPVIPRKQEFFVDKHKDYVYVFKFRTAKITTVTDFDNYLVISSGTHAGQLTTSYKVYAYDASSEGVFTTVCGLEKAGASVAQDWVQVEYLGNNTQHVMNATFPNSIGHARFTIAVRNDFTGETSVYASVDPVTVN